MAQPDAYCSTTPTPGTLLAPATLAAPCAHCGHATVLHIGVDHCPVCELVDLNERGRRLVDAGRVEIAVHGKPVDEAYLRDLLNKQIARHGPQSYIRRSEAHRA
jgi:hypothetical protein